MIFKMAAKAALLAGLVLIGLAPSFAEETSASGIQFYPPTNVAAGNGLLYFPKGGNQSLYAVPVISGELTAAVQQQTAAIMEQTEAIKKAQEKSAWQCNWSGGGIGGSLTFGSGCINSMTGVRCFCALGNNSCYCPPPQ